MLCAFSASTWNQLIEVKRDSSMLRTVDRPLPSGQLTKKGAVIYGCLTGVIGVGLAAMTGGVPALLAASNIGLYGAC